METGAEEVVVTDAAGYMKSVTYSFKPNMRSLLDLHLCE